MYMNKEYAVTSIEYEEICLMPVFPGSECSYVRYSEPSSAINSAALVTGLEWEKLVKSLMDQAHLRCRMPTYKTCVSDMLRANGFKPEKKTAAPIKTIIERLDGSFSEEKKYIVKFNNGTYCALIPDPIKGKYILKGAVYGKIFLEHKIVNALWEYIPQSDNRRNIRRVKEKVLPEARDGFEPINVNPENIGTGDCFIRALAAVCECDWHEALDIAAQVTGYKNPHLNSFENIDFTLETLGFERHKGLKHGRSYYSGKEMCDHFNRFYKNKGVRVFTCVGKTHCAAILPFGEGGETVYKVQDSWDSSDREIVEYWTDTKKASRDSVTKTATESDEYPIGTAVRHSKFGEGKVVGFVGDGRNRFIEIDFGSSVGKKKISEAWLKKERIKLHDEKFYFI